MPSFFLKCKRGGGKKPYRLRKSTVKLQLSYGRCTIYCKLRGNIMHWESSATPETTEAFSKEEKESTPKQQ